jgi:hypothetical protein
MPTHSSLRNEARRIADNAENPDLRALAKIVEQLARECEVTHEIASRAKLTAGQN